MKNCVPKCHLRAPLKADNPKASEWPQDILMRCLSMGTQNSLLAITRCGMRRSFHQPAKCSWTKAPNLPECQQRGGATGGHVYLTQCEPGWDLKHLA